MRETRRELWKVKFRRNIFQEEKRNENCDVFCVTDFVCKSNISFVIVGESHDQRACHTCLSYLNDNEETSHMPECRHFQTISASIKHNENLRLFLSFAFLLAIWECSLVIFSLIRDSIVSTKILEEENFVFSSLSDESLEIKRNLALILVIGSSSH